MTASLYLLAGAALTLALVWARFRFAGFRSQDPSHYAATGPEIDIRKHLAGPIICEGVVYGPLGRVTSRFVADMNGTWDGAQGRLTEAFRYDNGNAQNREWTLKLGNDGHIEATAPDIIGVGTGTQRGATVCLNYRIKLPETAGGHVLDVTDWMYLVENGTIINRSQFRKFGIKVAELVATMRKAA